MKAVNFVLKSAMGLVLGVAIGWLLAHRDTTPPLTPTGQPGQERKILYWRDP